MHLKVEKVVQFLEKNIQEIAFDIIVSTQHGRLVSL